MVFCNLDTLEELDFGEEGHNPYFNRWFSAITGPHTINMNISVTILILIDGFLQ